MNLARKLASHVKRNNKTFSEYIKRKRTAKVNVGCLENEAGELITAKKLQAWRHFFYISLHHENQPEISVGQS